jgi:type II secretory pathway pseudopilin PulG
LDFRLDAKLARLRYASRPARAIQNPKSKIQNPSRALTLFEVLISIVLIAMLLAALMTFFWQTLAVRHQAAAAIERTQIVQQMLERIAAELRGALPFEKVGFPVQVFTGDRRHITFLTAAQPPSDAYVFYRESEVRPPPQHDLREITYELWIDPEKTADNGDPLVGGILRTEQRVIIPSVTEDEVTDEERDLQYRRHDLWSHELGYLEFRYYDGVEWTTRWDVTKGNPVPHLVQITVGFDSLTKDELEDRDLQAYPIEQFPLGPDVPDINRFSKIVRLDAADQMFTAHVQRLGNQVEEVYQFMQGAPAEGAGELPGTGAPAGGKK